MNKVKIKNISSDNKIQFPLQIKIVFSITFHGKKKKSYEINCFVFNQIDHEFVIEFNLLLIHSVSQFN